MKTEDLQPLLAELSAAIGEGEFATPLKKVLQEAYNGQHTISEATLRVVNFLMGKYGVIVVNQDDKALKTIFAPMMKRELLERKTEQFKPRRRAAIDLNIARSVRSHQISRRKCA